MGLDIYVRWGENTPDEGWVGFPEELRQNQMTGFVSAPYAGYLRESWGSLRWVGDAADKFGGPNPYTLNKQYSGGNGDEMPVNTPESLQAALDFRTELLAYLRTGWRETQEKEYNALNETLKAKYGELKTDEQYEAWTKAHDELSRFLEAYASRITDMIGFINFIECNKDKPNITVCYY